MNDPGKSQRRTLVHAFVLALLSAFLLSQGAGARAGDTNSPSPEGYGAGPTTIKQCSDLHEKLDREKQVFVGNYSDCLDKLGIVTVFSGEVDTAYGDIQQCREQHFQLYNAEQQEKRFIATCESLERP